MKAPVPLGAPMRLSVDFDFRFVKRGARDILLIERRAIFVGIDGREFDLLHSDYFDYGRGVFIK